MEFKVDIYFEFFMLMKSLIEENKNVISVLFIIKHWYLDTNYIYLRTNDKQFVFSHDNICWNTFDKYFRFHFLFFWRNDFVIFIYVIVLDDDDDIWIHRYYFLTTQKWSLVHPCMDTLLQQFPFGSIFRGIWGLKRSWISFFFLRLHVPHIFHQDEFFGLYCCTYCRQCYLQLKWD